MLDCHDSFTFNLVQYLLELEAIVDVYEEDATTPQAVLAGAPTHIVLSPGPGRPQSTGAARALAGGGYDDAIPLLGVCLGHQVLCHAHGARVITAARIMHGKVSAIVHDGTGLFAGLPQRFAATRYHSLLVDEATLPPSLRAVARTSAGEVMAVAHTSRPAFGVQFHPESILTEHGHALLRRFLDRGDPS